MSSTIPSTSMATPQFASPMQGSPTPVAPQPAAKVQIQNDAEVVSKAVSTPIKSADVAKFAEETQVAVQKAAQEIESFLQASGRNLNISVDGTTGYHVVRVTNPETGEVIRQMPSPELLKIAQSLPNFTTGLVNTKA
jgi:flagellar protein FlaG